MTPSTIETGEKPQRVTNKTSPTLSAILQAADNTMRNLGLNTEYSHASLSDSRGNADRLSFHRQSGLVNILTTVWPNNRPTILPTVISQMTVY